MGGSCLAGWAEHSAGLDTHLGTSLNHPWSSLSRQHNLTCPGRTELGQGLPRAGRWSQSKPRSLGEGSGLGALQCIPPPSSSRQSALAQHTAALVLHTQHLPQQQNIPHHPSQTGAHPGISGSPGQARSQLRGSTGTISRAHLGPQCTHWGVSPAQLGSPSSPAAQGRKDTMMFQGPRRSQLGQKPL